MASLSDLAKIIRLRISLIEKRYDNHSGYNVYPAEIERVLAANPKVALAVVGKQSDELKGRLLRLILS